MEHEQVHGRPRRVQLPGRGVELCGEEDRVPRTRQRGGPADLRREGQRRPPHLRGRDGPEWWSGDCAVYRHAGGDLVVLPDGAALPVSLKVLEQEILTVSPIKDLAPGFRFAPIGLVDMFNSGGAVESLTYHLLGGAKLNGDGELVSSSEAAGMVCMEVRGCGRFGAYSSVRPRRCMLGSVETEFSYDSPSGLVVLQLDAMPKEKVHKVVVEL